MTRIVTLSTEGFAEWETTLLNAVAHAVYKVDVAYATPGGMPVTSSGGMTVTPNFAFEDRDVHALDALVVSGGSIWQTPAAPDLTEVLLAANAAGKVIGLIMREFGVGDEQLDYYVGMHAAQFGKAA